MGCRGSLHLAGLNRISRPFLSSFFGVICCRYIVGKSRHRAHTESQREESGESQFQGSLWRATLSREAWMPIWGLSTESMKPWPPPGGGRGYGTKRRRWCGGTGVPGGHDTHRPFTNRKAAPGEGTVIRARVGRPIPFRARSAQGPVHFPPTWRVMMRRCHPGRPGQGRRARAEGGGLGGGKGGRRARIFFFVVARARRLRSFLDSKKRFCWNHPPIIV